MSLRTTWLSWWNNRKFARRGIRNRFPFPDLTITGHVEIGDMCRFRNNVVLRSAPGARIVLGSRSGFSWNCVVDAVEQVRIGHRTGIAENTVIRDYVIDVSSARGSWRDSKKVGKPVQIGDDVFIGSNCYIGPGVTIGNGAIVAQHSLVTRDVGAYEVWDGRPARKMAHRVDGVPERVRAEVERLISEQGVATDRNAGSYRMGAQSATGFNLRRWFRATWQRWFG